MTREQVIRWCAIREKAADAVSEAKRHIGDLAALTGGETELLEALVEANSSLAEAGTMLVLAKAAVVGALRDAA